MFLVICIILSILIGVIVPQFFMKDKEDRRYGHEGEIFSLFVARMCVRGVCLAVGLTCFVVTSCVIIDKDSVGHLERVYMGSSMKPGQIIADKNQKGPQARIITAGFHFMPFVRVTHNVKELPIVTVPEGKYAFLIAKDGAPMPEGQFIAPAFKDPSNMIDAEKFLGFEPCDDTVGVKGPQLTVLPPGDYRINRYLFDVKAGESTAVPTGYVLVIKSNVGDDYKGDPILPDGVVASELSVPLVPKGYRGVWSEVYTPGEYYINQRAYETTLVDTRVQTWKYIGGYTRKWIDLTIQDDGKIHQEPHEEIVKVPEDAADTAIILRVQGWDVFQDSRVQVQVTPEHAPFVVASVGGIQAIEDKIITPNYRSIVRNVVSEPVKVKEAAVNEKGKPILNEDGTPKMVTKERAREVLDLLYHREELEKAVASKLAPTGAKAGLNVQWVRFGDPAVPPSLLIPGKRTQLAQSLSATYKQEKLSQTERVETEKERARADEQNRLMKSQIGITVADNNALARQKEGNGEKSYMESVAKGQMAQANVLGKDKAFELAYIKTVLDAAAKNPDMIKFPTTFVMGSGGNDLSGAAAILGASNLSLGLTKTTSAK